MAIEHETSLQRDLKQTEENFERVVNLSPLRRLPRYGLTLCDFERKPGQLAKQFGGRAVIQSLPRGIQQTAPAITGEIEIIV